MTIYYIDHDATPFSGDINEIDASDPSLNDEKMPSLDSQIALPMSDFSRLFLSGYDLDYLCDYSYSPASGMRVVTHPDETDTCFEKAKLLGSWDPLNIIKVFYLECPSNGLLYAVVVPETGCFIDRVHMRQLLDLADDTYLKKAESLPGNMSFGTCSPFILENDIVENGGRVARILFDTDTLELKRDEQTLDDFSFGMDHRMSMQMNYFDCYNMLKTRHPVVIEKADVLRLSFKEKLVRNKGKIRISYEFNTLNYRTARFINSIHGYGDVTLLNDYVDEMNLPDIISALTSEA